MEVAYVGCMLASFWQLCICRYGNGSVYLHFDIDIGLLQK